MRSQLWIATVTSLWVCIQCVSAQEPKLAVADLHFHWEGKASLDKLIAESAAQGVKLGITGEGGATWGLSGDQAVAAFLAKLDGQPVYRGLQV